MRWRLLGAKAMLNVRAIHQSDYCADFHTHRRQTEQATLHPLHELLNDYLRWRSFDGHSKCLI
jgi:alkylhydroperoxidase family enzyme